MIYKMTMIHGKEIITLKEDKDYLNWLIEIKQRFLSQRLKASSAVNANLLEFYLSVGKDIEVRQYANTYGSGFFDNLSKDMKRILPGVQGLSPINLRYMNRFYRLYSLVIGNLPQAAEDFNPTPKANVPQPAEDLALREIMSIPWDHHRRIIDKCGNDVQKALFFVKKTHENNWSRNVLVNWLSTDLYEREGKAITNFSSTLPEIQGDLAQQITKDPYLFDFLSMREDYDERDLEDALVSNVTKFLLELGKGFSYMGRQLRIVVGSQEFFPDLLFYNTHIHAYVVIELKAQTFKPEFLGQLSFYVSAVNNQMKTEADNPTIGLLICKDKDSIVAKYALDPYKEPLGIAEYQLSKLYPKDLKSSLPSIEEIESELKHSTSDTKKKQ